MFFWVSTLKKATASSFDSWVGLQGGGIPLNLVL